VCNKTGDITVDSNIETNNLPLHRPICAELYVPKTEEIVPVVFDGVSLTVNGITEYTHRKRDGEYIKLVIEKTLANPDKEVYKDDLIFGYTPKAQTIKNIVDSINYSFKKTEVKPVHLVFEPKTHPYDTLKLNYVTFVSGTNINANVQPNTKNVKDTSSNFVTVRPKITFHNKNESWLKDLQTEQSDLKHVQFEKMTQHEVLLCRILHKRVGSETAVLDIKTLFEEETESKIPLEDFMTILKFWAQKYSTSDPLKRRIAMRKIMHNGQPSASFIWHRPDYSK